MTKVKGQGSLLVSSFDGKSKSLFPSLKTSKFFAGTKNLILLSIKGNDFCRGEYLGAIVSHSVEKHEFTTLLIADEIYWHNLKLSEVPTPDEMHDLKNTALQLGEQYFEEQCGQFLKPLKIDPVQFQLTHTGKTVKEKIAIINELAHDHGFEILRWIDWVARMPAHIQTEYVFDLYSSDLKLKKSLHEQANNFARRHSSLPDNTATYDLLYMRSHGYLREESFDIIWLSAWLNYNFIVYPGDMPKPFAATREYFVKSTDLALPPAGLFIQSDKPERLANWLEVNFTRKPGPEELAKPAKQRSLMLPSPNGTGLALNPGSTSPYNGPTFFPKPTKPEDNIHAKDEQVVTLAAITEPFLTSEVSFENKYDYIVFLVNFLSTNGSPIELSACGMAKII